jgi:hypothetical protein
VIHSDLNPVHNSIQEKIHLEHEAAKLFMRLYEKQYGAPMRHIWHNLPRKPDVSCYLNDSKLDLEIAHIYGSEAEAKLILGREADEKMLAALHHLTQLPVNSRLIAALNAVLNSKAQKNYHTQRVWLVLRNMNSLWQQSDFEKHRQQIVLPHAHPFEQIWLLGDAKGRSGVMQLFPTSSQFYSGH